VAHAKLTGHHLVTQRRSSVTRESQRRVARRSRTLSGDWLDHRRKQRPLHVTLATRRKSSIAPRKDSILNRSWIFERCSRQRLLAREHSRVAATRRTRRVSRFDFFAQSCDRVTNRIAHRYAVTEFTARGHHGSPMPIELHRGEVESFRGVTPLAIREYLSGRRGSSTTRPFQCPETKDAQSRASAYRTFGKMRTWCPL